MLVEGCILTSYPYYCTIRTVFLTLGTTRSFVIIVAYFLPLHFSLITMLYVPMINNEQEQLHIVISQKAITYTVLEGHFTGRALPIGQVEVTEE